MPIIDHITAQELLKLDSAEGVEAFLRRVEGDGILENDDRWIPVGGQISNAGSIEASADEVNPIVERIVNGMESVIELEVTNADYEPNDPHEAIAKLFSVPRGRARLLDSEEARKQADRVEVLLRGEIDRPTVVVKDRGIGIHPSDFSDTVLSLGNSSKGQKPYFIGMYGHGGSSTFDKCEYTVIVSRRARDCLRDGQDDVMGWTIVRRKLKGRAHVYNYLVDAVQKQVPSISKEFAELLEFKNGTQIAHVCYRGLGSLASQLITNNAFYTLNYRLFDPLLPWRLEDQRPKRRSNRTMRGIPARADQRPKAAGIGSIEARRRGEQTAVRHHINYVHKMESGSNLRVEWWVFQDEQAEKGRRRRNHQDRLRPYRDQTRRYARRVVAITRGGQTHAALTSQVFRDAGLKEVARSVIVNVDTDGLTYVEGAGFFASNRADLKSESQRAIERAIEAAIDVYADDLKAIERERQAEIVSGRSASDEDQIRKRLDPIIRAFHTNSVGLGSGEERSGSRDMDFKGKETPTYLKFARTGPLDIRPGIRTRVDLLTDAADHVVRASDVRLVTESDNDLLLLGEVQGRAGRYILPLIPSAELSIGERVNISARITRQGVFDVAARQLCRLRVVPPPEEWIGVDPPSFIKFRSRSGEIHVRQGGGRITLETDAKDDLVMKGGKINIERPSAGDLPLPGIGDPRRGEVRINLNVPTDHPLGSVGRIKATMIAPNRGTLSDTAMLVVIQRTSNGSTIGPERLPGYEIHDVREIGQDPEDFTWSAMPQILEDSDPWTSKDVGAFYVQELESERNIHFYINVDNIELNHMERRVARMMSVQGVDLLRGYHRTVVCSHLYAIAISPNGDDSAYRGNYGYRDEMIRVGTTALFTYRQFVPGVDLDD